MDSVLQDGFGTAEIMFFNHRNQRQELKQGEIIKKGRFFSTYYIIKDVLPFAKTIAALRDVSQI